MDRYRLPLQRQHCSCCIGYPGHETDERPDKQGSHAGVQQVCPPVLVCIALNGCGREQSPACSPAPSPLPARRALDRVEGATRGLNLLQERLRQVGRTPVRCAAVTKVCTRWRTAGPGRSRRASAASPPSPASCRGRRRGGARQPAGQTVRPPDKPRNTISQTLHCKKQRKNFLKYKILSRSKTERKNLQYWRFKYFVYSSLSYLLNVLPGNLKSLYVSFYLHFHCGVYLVMHVKTFNKVWCASSQCCLRSITDQQERFTMLYCKYS